MGEILNAEKKTTKSDDWQVKAYGFFYFLRKVDKCAEGQQPKG